MAEQASPDILLQRSDDPETRCQSCGKGMLELIEEWPHPLFGVLGVSCQTFKCDDCGHPLSRYEPTALGVSLPSRRWRRHENLDRAIDGSMIASPRANSTTEMQGSSRSEGMGSARSMQGDLVRLTRASPPARRPLM
jgi:hypothetical protein